MDMEIIQPFLNAADAVLAETLDCHTRMDELCMDPEPYRSKGVAAVITLAGDVEGHIIVDADPSTAIRIAGRMAGVEVPESEQAVRETICELANQVIGNAVTTLNDQGFHFKVLPPKVHQGEAFPTTHDTEALLMRFETPNGFVYFNIALRYGRGAQHQPSFVAART